eukprot:CAMPEP_0185752282 /NCGR_PEP_ID=MMETSP1174-20130828/11091_1 /TAXON_ID=35687 /ORGANISM="Dictyocha speculum, Strain CCMP1381" /LENGTH=197 /DNA_ID=CAMNT_0028429675 /DNA_START=27 /DNA_END=620 /DNA_ORIENTATION=-
MAPGELRLRHDLKDARFMALCVTHGIQVTVLHTHVQIHVSSPGSDREGSYPDLFTVRVPHYYPHEPPLVFAGMRWHSDDLWRQIVAWDGRVVLQSLTQDWNATRTFEDVVKILLDQVIHRKRLVGCTTPLTVSEPIACKDSRIEARECAVAISREDASFLDSESAMDTTESMRELHPSRTQIHTRPMRTSFAGINAI